VGDEFFHAEGETGKQTDGKREVWRSFS